LHLGDWIEVDGHLGRVAEIKWGSTSLATKEGNLVSLPNSRLVSNAVVNFSRPSLPCLRAIRVGFHYRHPPERVERVLRQAAGGVPGVLAHPPPECIPRVFGENAVVYEVRYWLQDFERDEQIEGAVLSHVWHAARRAGLEIPFPARTVYLPNEHDIV